MSKLTRRSNRSEMHWPMMYRGRRCKCILRRGDQTQVQFMEDNSREWVLSSMVEIAKTSNFVNYTIKSSK